MMPGKRWESDDGAGVAVRRTRGSPMGMRKRGMARVVVFLAVGSEGRCHVIARARLRAAERWSS